MWPCFGGADAVARFRKKCVTFKWDRWGKNTLKTLEQLHSLREFHIFALPKWKYILLKIWRGINYAQIIDIFFSLIIIKKPFSFNFNTAKQAFTVSSQFSLDALTRKKTFSNLDGLCNLLLLKTFKDNHREESQGLLKNCLAKK